MSGNTKGKLSLVGLSLMIFTSVYGFNNIPRAFYKMGYSAIPWYIIGGLFFFLPFAFMVTEMGSAFKNEKGGIYSWMEKAAGPTFALIGTFMWYASYVIWMVNVSTSIMAPLTTFVTGDPTYITNISTKVLSIIAIVWMIFITFASSKGINAITKFTNAGGFAVLALNGVLLVGALIVLLLNGHPATPVTLHSFVSTPAPTSLGTTGFIGAVAFMVFAIFAYGGVEAVGGLVDETDQPEKNFPKGVVVSALIITVGYSLMILLVGMFMNYQSGGQFMKDVVSQKVSLGNIGYYTIQQLGLSLGNAFHLSASGASIMSNIFARFMGLAMTLSLCGAFFTLCYSPVKQIISGTPDKLWPGNYGKLDAKTGMPRNAMMVQLIIVVIFILLNMLMNLVGGASGANASAVFFAILTNMTNVAMTLPYLMIVIAFVKFKLNDDIEKPFTIFKSKGLAIAAAAAALIVVGFANLFTIIQPILQPAVAAPLSPAVAVISMVGGPILFAVVAIILMNNYKKK